MSAGRDVHGLREDTEHLQKEGDIVVLAADILHLGCTHVVKGPTSAEDSHGTHLSARRRREMMYIIPRNVHVPGIVLVAPPLYGYPPAPCPIPIRACHGTAVHTCYRRRRCSTDNATSSLLTAWSAATTLAPSSEAAYNVICRQHISFARRHGIVSSIHSLATDDIKAQGTQSRVRDEPPPLRRSVLPFPERWPEPCLDGRRRVPSS